MGRYAGGLVGGVVLLAGLWLTGCEQQLAETQGYGVTSPATDEQVATSSMEQSGSTRGASGDRGTEVSDDQVHEVLLAMDDALQAGDVEAYLAHVGPELQDRQRAWFDGVSTAPLEMRQLRLDGVVSRTPTEGTVAHVGLRHQFSGADPVPVLQQYRWVFAATQQGPPLLVESRGRNGEFFGHPQLWDLGEELAVLTGHRVDVLVQRSRMADAETILDTLDRAAETSLTELPWLAQGRDRLVVQLVPAEVLEEHGWPESSGSSLPLKVSPEEIPRDAGRLTGMRSPVQAHLFLDLDLALLDLEEYGPSPGGQTELRYMAASSATAGEDVEAWPEDWILEGPPSWWSSVEDPAYAEHLLLSAGDHFATEGPPTAFPTVPMDPEDLIAADAYTLESIALTYYLEETYGRDRLIDLVGRLIVLDQRHDEDQIEQAYREALGSDRDDLLDGFARWTQTLSTVDEESETSVPGR